MFVITTNSNGDEYQYFYNSFYCKFLFCHKTDDVLEVSRYVTIPYGENILIN
jgi:hypothetical protein